MFRKVKSIAALLVCFFLLGSCGEKQEQEEVLPTVEVNEADAQERDSEISAAEGLVIEDSTQETEQLIEDSTQETGLEMEDSAPETLQEIPTEENGIMEIYDGRNEISFSEGIMIAQISPQEILSGNPVLYDRFRTDGWVFEWLISDFCNEDNDSLEDGVLVISLERDMENTQVIHVTAEGGYGTWVSAENKFEYVDVNFDDIPDLLICTGHHGNQGLLTYYCFLQTEDGFVESPTFTDISNPSIDAEQKLILSQWRNWAASHSWAEYKCQNDTYTRYRELCEEAVWDEDADEDIWVWTVNDEEVLRSDKCSDEEIFDFLYGESSEWQIVGDRWRTIYNNGPAADYSIYAEP